MPFNSPNPPSGDSRQTNWNRRLKQSSDANRVLPGRGYRTKYTSQGTILEIDPGGASGGPTITVTACDPNTGDVVTYELRGRLVTET